MSIRDAIYTGIMLGFWGTAHEATERRARAVPLSGEVRKCPQCWKDKPVEEFGFKVNGERRRQCDPCKERVSVWNQRYYAERDAKHTGRFRHTRTTKARRTTSKDDRVLFMAESKNQKLGRIPATITDQGSCPPSCGFFGKGCFAEYHVLAHHWRGAARRGLTWSKFLERIRALPAGQLWRHNVAGDLPGRGEYLDASKLAQLGAASLHTRGFSFTHKHLTNQARGAVAMANSLPGFTVNLSADSIAQADELVALGIGPVAVVVPEDAPNHATRTPAGHQVVMCPAEATEGMTCARCGLCAKTFRKSIVAFRAHGQSKKLVSEIVRSKRAA